MDPHWSLLFCSAAVSAVAMGRSLVRPEVVWAATTDGACPLEPQTGEVGRQFFFNSLIY